MTKKGTQDAKSSYVTYDTYSKKLKSPRVKSVDTKSQMEPENEETTSGKKETVEGSTGQHRPTECHLEFPLQVSAVTSQVIQICHTWLHAPMLNPL